MCKLHLFVSLLFSNTKIKKNGLTHFHRTLPTLEVVQSRRVYNNNTEYHEQIVNLVNANRGLISRRMKAIA